MTRLFKVSAVSVLLAGCLVTRPEIPKPECETDSQCAAGKICGPAGKCTNACTTINDCDAPRLCTANACVLPAGTCQRVTDCAADQTCLNFTCMKKCTGTSECSAGQACLNGGCTTLVSPPPECKTNAECTGGKICGPNGACTSACATTNDCDVPRVCTSGACVLPAGSCQRAADCLADQTCLSASCVKKCAAATECNAGQACLSGGCTTLSNPAPACRFTSECPAAQSCIGGRCSEACLADRDCPLSTSCQTGFCTPTTPDCFANSDCTGGKACSPPGKCVTACASVAECVAGEACANGACTPAGPTTATISGSVVLTNVGDRSGLSVSAAGPNFDSAVTNLDGGFRFEGLLPGLYTLKVDAPNTVEGSGTVSVAAKANATTIAATITLTPAGTISGNVTLAGRTSHEGIQIVALGTTKGATTIPNGDFQIRQLPVGTYNLLITAPGFQSAQVSAVPVTYGMTRVVTAQVLQPVPSGSSFAFTSIPPTTQRFDKPFTYQAVAGGGGVGAVTYALVSSPSGMTINANTGQVTWQPASNGTYFIGLSANGGGQLIYQVFDVVVTSGSTVIQSVGADRIEATDGGFWTIDTGGIAHFVTNSGVATPIAPPVQYNGTVSSLTHLNGIPVTGLSWKGGTFTGVRGPLGTVGGGWEGGVVGSVVGLDRQTLQSAALSGGNASALTLADGDTISAVSYPTGVITGTDAGIATFTALKVNTGIASAVNATTVTDSAGTYVSNALVGQFVSNASGLGLVPITANTATDITVSSDPTTTLAVGQRYFIVDASGTAAFVFEDSAANFPDAGCSGCWTGKRVDLYTQAVSVGAFAPVATQVTPTSVTIRQSPTQYATLLEVRNNGFYVLAANSSGIGVEFRDSTNPFPATGLSTANRFTLDDFAYPVDILANNTGALIARMPFGSARNNYVGRKWVLTDTTGSPNIPVTATLTTGGRVPGSLTSLNLWVDVAGYSYDITANTANTVTVSLPYYQFPLPQWVGSETGFSGGSPSNPYVPRLKLSSAGLVPGALAGRWVMLLTGGSAPFIANDLSIQSNDATSLLIAEDYCYGCTNRISQLRSAVLSSRWAPGTQVSARRVDFTLTLSGAPGYAVDALKTRLVALEADPSATGVILGNTANTLTVEVDETDFPAFQRILAGDKLWLSQPGPTTPLNVRVTAVGASWATNQWAGYSVVTSNNRVAGSITQNGANTLDLTVTDFQALLALSAGSNFGFGFPHSGGAACTGSQWVRADVTLPGATLQAGYYTHLRSSAPGQPRLPLLSNSTTGGVLLVCSNAFSTLISIVGRPAVLDRGGTFDVTFIDSAATYAVNELAGQRVYSSGTFNQPISSNTATEMSILGYSSGNWFNDPYAKAQAGSQYAIVASGSSDLVVTANTSATLVPGAVAGRVVRLNDRITNTSSLAVYATANSASQVTVFGLTGSDLTQLAATGTAAFAHLTTSNGTVLRVTDSTANHVPGALVGRLMGIGSRSFTILSNTATQLVGASTKDTDYGDVATSTTYRIFAPTLRNVGSALPNGNLLTAYSYGGTSNDALAIITPSGGVTQTTPLSGTQALTLTAPVMQRGVLANQAVQTGVFITWTEGQWTWTPNSLVGQYIRVQDGFGINFRTLLITANTGTSITAQGYLNYPNLQNGRFWSVFPSRYTVAGGGLTPGALKGKTIRIQGSDFTIRDNTAGDLTLWIPETFAGTALDIADTNATGFVLDGLPSNSSIRAVTSDGAAGYWVTSDATLAHFDGSTWSRFAFEDTATQVATGTVGSIPSSGVIVDTAAAFAPNSLAGQRLTVNGTTYVIGSNTSNSITASGSSGLQGPTVGATYRVLANDGLAPMLSLANNGATLWVGTSAGLYRRAGSTWTRFTVASTESSPGAADGLPSDAIERLRVVGNSDLYAMTLSLGASRLIGSSWTRFTAANTESAPGALDGLANNTVYDVFREPNGNVWFSHNVGSSRLAGSTWTQFGQAQGVFGSVLGTYVAPQGDVFLGYGQSLVKLLP